MKPNPPKQHSSDAASHPGDDEFAIQPVPERARVTRPKTGPLPNLRPKSGPASNLRPKSGATANLRPRSGAIPLPSEEPLDDGIVENLDEPSPDLTIEEAESGEKIAGATLPADAPPPKPKVDFENLPEFVWQRKMLMIVRVVAVVVFTIIMLLVGAFVYNSFRAARESVKPITDGQQPPVEEKSNP